MSGIIGQPGSKSGILGRQGALGYEELNTTIIDFGNGSYGSGGFSGKVRSNEYVTRIGNIVHIGLRVTLTHSGNTNGTTIIIRALPYPPASNSNMHGVIALMSATGSASTISGGDTSILRASTNPATDAWPVSSLAKPSGTSGTSTWQVSFTYTTDQY